MRYHQVRGTLRFPVTCPECAGEVPSNLPITAARERVCSGSLNLVALRHVFEWAATPAGAASLAFEGDMPTCEFRSCASRLASYSAQTRRLSDAVRYEQPSLALKASWKQNAKCCSLVLDRLNVDRRIQHFTQPLDDGQSDAFTVFPMAFNLLFGRCNSI